ncbi:MAG: extracellular solute-binding protein [Stappiaceae bacterium]
MKIAAGSALLPMLPGVVHTAFAAEQELHGLSVFGDLKYAPDFTHFDYVNPSAPRTGSLSYLPGYWFYNQNTQTFNTLNGFVLRGDAPPRVDYCFDTLMVRAWDEPDAIYGLVAKSVQVSKDGNTYVFTLRPEARFHDGSSLTADDVAWSIDTLMKEGHPTISLPLKPISGVKALAANKLEIIFDGTQSRQLPMTVAVLPIFSKTYYADRDFTQSTLDRPLGSGPYKFGNMSPGKFIEYERVDDYWAKDLPVTKGQHNFKTLRIEFFRERQTAFEAFKKGVIEFRQEFTSKTWATAYDFPAIKDGRVIKELIPQEKRPLMQGWHINTRRAKFADPRTRRAIGLCFDFEWTNKNLFFDTYKRLTSYFEQSNLKASGKPSAAELALLEPYRGQVPPEVFEEAYVPPVSNGSGSDRTLLRQASQLLKEAGWQRRGTSLVDKDGNPLTVEFLIRAQVFESVLGKYIQNLRAVGIEGSIRLVDPPQYQARTTDYDFDVLGGALGLLPTPLEGLDTAFGSQSAKAPGSGNYAGIADPVVDALIEMISQSQSREDMTNACRALDRVLRAHHYWVPNWYIASHRVAVWDKFGRPENKPDYWFPFEATWWEDKEKAARLEKAG